MFVQCLIIFCYVVITLKFRWIHAILMTLDFCSKECIQRSKRLRADLTYHQEVARTLCCRVENQTLASRRWRELKARRCHSTMCDARMSQLSSSSSSVSVAMETIFSARRSFCASLCDTRAAAVGGASAATNRPGGRRRRAPPHTSLTSSVTSSINHTTHSATYW